jgi:hypothetical protein
MMKEIPSDSKVIEPQDYPLACIDCATHMIWDQRLLIKRDEYERLKEIEAKYKELCK